MPMPRETTTWPSRGLDGGNESMKEMPASNPMPPRMAVTPTSMPARSRRGHEPFDGMTARPPSPLRYQGLVLAARNTASAEDSHIPAEPAAGTRENLAPNPWP